MKKMIAFSALLMLAGTAQAQHSHGHQKGPNGGEIQDVAGVHAEVIVKGDTVTLYITEEGGKPSSTKGYSGSALVAAGNAKETLNLSPAGENQLSGQAKQAISSKANVTILFKTAAGKTGQIKHSVHGH
ncbi:MAG: hypothetical protein LCH39_01550 [Proteobacteria bacterium]|nr:hypothetical protein [Pseudomonadota bacterium]